MNHFTNFFSKLSEYTKDIDITLRIKEKDGKYTILVQPEIANASKVKPLTATGTPAELDNEFYGLFQQQAEVVAGLKTNIDEVKADAAQVKEEGNKKTPSATAGNTKPKDKGAGKSVKKTEPVKKKTASKPTADDLPDIFSQGAASASDQSKEGAGELPEEMSEPGSEPVDQEADHGEDASTETGSADEQE